MSCHHCYNMDSKDSPDVESYWLTTVLEDRAESAPPPADEETEQ